MGYPLNHRNLTKDEWDAITGPLDGYSKKTKKKFLIKRECVFFAEGHKCPYPYVYGKGELKTHVVLKHFPIPKNN